MATAPKIQVHIDPFFDGEPGFVKNTQVHGLFGTAEYTEPNKVRLENGEPLLRALPSGPRGLMGMVIPHATAGGVPRGVNPHDVSKFDVHIDPHLHGQSSTIRLGRLNNELLLQGMQISQEQTPEGDTLEMNRLRASTAFHAVAQLVEQADRGAPKPMGVGIAAQSYQPPAPASQAVAVASLAAPRAAAVSPLQALRQASAAPVPESPAVAPVTAAPLSSPASAPTPAPQYSLLFEIENFGQLEAFYHDVKVQTGADGDGQMVLVYDRRFKGTKWWPPTGENAKPMGVCINGGDEVYLVHTTGFQYADGDKEYCVLMIERTVRQSDLPAAGV